MARNISGYASAIQTDTKKIADAVNMDAFHRNRVSNPGQRLDVEFIYDKQPYFFDELTSNGSVTHNANTRQLNFALSDANNGSYAEMRSHPTIYTPGCSHHAFITGVLDLANIGGGTCELFLRSSISGSAVDLMTKSQSSWLNFSSQTSVWNTSFIFSVDFQSLKVGTIRYYIIHHGTPVLLWEEHNDFTRASGYWQLPSLPVSYKLYTTGGFTYMEMAYGDANNAVGIRYKISANASATMAAICCTVSSEGGDPIREIRGIPRSIDRGVTAKTVSTTIVPIISIRPRATFNSITNLGIAIPKEFHLQTDNDIRYVIIHNATTLTGASWTNVDTNGSAMEYDVSATVVAGGNNVHSGYLVGGTGSAHNDETGILGKLILWRRQDSITGTLTIAGVRTGASDAAVLCGFTWDEMR